MIQAIEDIKIRPAVKMMLIYRGDANISMAKEIEDLDLDRTTLTNGVNSVFAGQFKVVLRGR